MKISLYDKVAQYVFFATIGLLPIFFIPAFQTSLSVSKGILLAVGVLFSAIFFTIGRINEGSISVPSSWKGYLLLALPVVTLISTLLSSSPRTSFIGTGFDIGTFFSITLFSLIAYLAFNFLQTRSNVMRLFACLFIGGIAAILFQYIGVFANITNNLFFTQVNEGSLYGGMNNLGLFVGLFSILSLIALEWFTLKKLYKGIALASWILSLVLFLMINFKTALILFGVVTLSIFVIGVLKNKEKRKLPVFSFISVMIAIIFIFANGFLGTMFNSWLGVSTQEIRPSVESTVSVATDIAQNNLVAGMGPNRFNQAWSLYQPEVINATPFWSVDFTSGFGLLPTFMINGGIIGSALWLLFIIISIMLVISLLRSRYNAVFPKQSFIVSAIFTYLLVLSIVYVPNFVTLTLLFVFLGFLFASQSNSTKKISLNSSRNTEDNVTFNGQEESGTKFAFVFTGMVLVVLFVGGLIIIGGKIISRATFISGVSSFYAEGIGSSEEKLLAGAKMGNADFYYRDLADIYVSQMRVILADPSIGVDDAKVELQYLITKAEQSAVKAVEFDDQNYINWITLAKVYANLSSIKISNAFENAVLSYEKAQELHPTRPSILLDLARLNIQAEEYEKSREYIRGVARLKPNYIEGAFVLAQLELLEGNDEAALATIEQIVKVAPNNADAYLRLGILRYDSSDLDGSISALVRSINLKDSLTARYFLGLSYDGDKQKTQALEQFNVMKAVLPNNTQIAKIIQNINEGVSALEGVSEPVQSSDIFGQDIEIETTRSKEDVNKIEE